MTYVEAHSFNEEKYRYLTSSEFINRLNNALKIMGPKFVKKEYRHLWSKEQPSIGYCYVICEFLHHIYPETTAKIIPTVEGNHWFLELPNGQPLDLAKDKDYNYSTGIRRNFMTKNPSKRASLLGKLMKIQNFPN